MKHQKDGIIIWQILQRGLPCQTPPPFCTHPLAHATRMNHPPNPMSKADCHQISPANGMDGSELNLLKIGDMGRR